MSEHITQRQKVEAKEAAILAAAHAAFAEAGFDGTKMAGIARRAAVAEGTLYLYYRNKAELLEAVVARFWRRLTDGARLAIQEHTSAIDQLESLGRYHLTQVIADYDFVELTSQVRQQQQRSDASLEPIRQYVRVFDEVFARGVDRGELRSDVTGWQWRDLFYGQLEYSARTLILRDQQSATEPVIAHLRGVLLTGLTPGSLTNKSPAPDDELQDLSQQLSGLADRLAALSTAERNTS